MQLRAERPVTGAAGEAAIPAVSMHQVGLSFGVSSLERRLVLANITLDVREGEFLCVVGPSGSGKTTLLRLLAGLIRPTTGEVRFRGEAVSGPSRERAIIFQDYSKALLPWRNVIGNIALSLEGQGMRASEQQPASPRSSPRWASSTPRTNTQDNFPAACSSACKSPAVSRSIRRSF